MIRLISLAIERQHEGLSWHAVQDVEIYIGVDDSRQGRDKFVYISDVLYTVYRIPTVYLCKRYNTYFGHMFGRFDSPHCDHCKFFQGMAAAARSVFFVMCLLVRHQKLIILRIVASDSSGLRSWFYMFFPLPSRSWLRAQ